MWNINKLNEHMGCHTGFACPSADKALRIMDESKTENTVIQNEEVTHTFNYHQKLNNTPVQLTIKVGTLIPGSANTLDFDNVILEHEKDDTAKNYKMTTGYQPAIAAIGRQVVFIEGRGGNTPAAYRMDETLKNCFECLRQNELHIEHFRSDSTAYQKDVVEVVEQNSNYFYIRIDDSQNLRDAIRNIPEHEWKKVKMGIRTVEVADTPFIPFKDTKCYRAIVQRRKRKDGQYDMFTQAFMLIILL